MSDLTEAFWFYKNAQRVSPDGPFEAILDAARKWNDLTSPENVEKVARILAPAMVKGYDLHEVDDMSRQWIMGKAEAVLRAVEDQK